MICDLCFVCFLSQSQVEQVNDIFSREYHVRRRVLLKRIDLTIQSFLWNEKGKVSSLFLIPCHHSSSLSFVCLNISKSIIFLTLD